MLEQAFSLLERLLPRLVSASLVFVLAFVSNPSQVGLYGWGLTVLTGYQAVTDGAIRQMLIRLVGTNQGIRYLRRFRILASCAAVPVLLMSFAAFGLLAHVEWKDLAVLLPIAFAPIGTFSGLESLGRLQRAGQWRGLAQSQFFAVSGGALVSLPVLIVTRSALGPSTHLLACEVLFAAFVRRRARRLRTSVQVNSDVARTDHAAMVAYTGLAWAQGQGDRLMIGAVAGPGVLGLFTTGSALARSISDSLAAASANYLRPALTDPSRHPTAEELRDLARPILNRGMWLAVACALATMFAVDAVARPILGRQWDSSLRLATIVTAVAVPSVLSWSGSVLQLAANRSANAIWSPVLGLVIVPLIAIAATKSLVLAGVLVVFRELTVATASFVLARRSAPWSSYVRCLGLTSALFGVALLIH